MANTPQEKKMRSIRLFVVGLIAMACAGCWDTGSGEKVGIITRVAQTGAFCKTWEATLIRGGLTGGSGAFSQPFDFTIENRDDAVEVLRQAMESGAEVKITYRSEMATFCRSDSGDHFLTSLTIIKKPEGK